MGAIREDISSECSIGIHLAQSSFLMAAYIRTVEVFRASRTAWTPSTSSIKRLSVYLNVFTRYPLSPLDASIPLTLQASSYEHCTAAGTFCFY